MGGKKNKKEETASQGRSFGADVQNIHHPTVFIFIKVGFAT